MNVQGRTVNAVTLPGYGVMQGVGGAGSLLPSPTPLDAAQLDDAMTMLLALSSQQSAASMKAGKADVDSARIRQQEKMKEAAEAYRKQKEAENNPFAWLMDLFKAIVAIASAVASVFTCGATGALATTALVLSAGSMLVEKTQMFGPEASNIVGSAMGFLSNLATLNAGGMISSGAGIVSASLAATHDKTASDWALAIGVGGSAAGSLTSFGTSLVGGLGKEGAEATKELSKTDRVLRAGAKIVEGGAQVGEGLSTIGNGIRESDRLNSSADMKKARHEMEKLSRLIDVMIAGLEDIGKDQKKATDAINGAIKINGQTMVVAAGAVRG